MKNFDVPTTLEVDAYSAGHFEMIPPGMENFQCSQVVYRKPLFQDDNRVVMAGLSPFILLEMTRQISMQDIKEAFCY